MPLIFSILILLLSTSVSFAKVNGLMNWQENGANVILPKIEGKEANKVPQLYKSAIEESEVYKKYRPFFGKNGTLSDTFQKGKIADPLSTKDQENTVPFALFANNPDLMNPKDKPFQHFKQSLGSLGATLYIIPFGIDTLLKNNEDLKSYFDLISQQFPALISAGGGDLDPSLYGEKNSFSVEPNLVRDQTELQLIRTFVDFGQGLFYGVCRGHQAYAVAMGGTLIQDLPEQLSPNVIHRPTKNPDGTLSSSWHSITLKNKENALFQAVDKDTFLVNSRHHQAVKSLPPEKGDIIALAGESVIEAVEKKDSKGQLKVLTFQFHPEDMDTQDSEKIIKLMIDQARKVRHIDPS